LRVFAFRGPYRGLWSYLEGNYRTPIQILVPVDEIAASLCIEPPWASIEFPVAEQSNKSCVRQQQQPKKILVELNANDIFVNKGIKRDNSHCDDKSMEEKLKLFKESKKTTLNKNQTNDLIK
jgi:hypothetical protein